MGVFFHWEQVLTGACDFLVRVIVRLGRIGRFGYGFGVWASRQAMVATSCTIMEVTTGANSAKI